MTSENTFSEHSPFTGRVRHQLSSGRYHHPDLVKVGSDLRYTLLRMFDDLSVPVFTSKNTGTGMSLGHVVEVKNYVLRHLREWLFDYVPKLDEWSPHHVKKHLRFAQALSAALDSGALVVADANDLKTFYFAVSSGLHDMNQAVEYYARTGELLDIIAEIVAQFDRGEVGRGALDMTPASAMLLRVQLYRTYLYDASRVQECFIVGRDRREHMSLPLEVRMNFAETLGIMNAAEERRDRSDDPYPDVYDYDFDDDMFPRADTGGRA